MTILNFGSLNIDHVYRVAHLVRPRETIASTPKFNGPEIFIMKILLIYDDEKNHFPYKQNPWGDARDLFSMCADLRVEPAVCQNLQQKFSGRWQKLEAARKVHERVEDLRKKSSSGQRIYGSTTPVPHLRYTPWVALPFCGDQLMDDADWKRHKAKKMFKLLLMARQRQLRGEQVMETLWPDKTQMAAR